VMSPCVCLSLCEHVSATTTSNFTSVSVAVARSFFGGIAIRYVLPFFWMTSCFDVLDPVAACATAAVPQQHGCSTVSCTGSPANAPTARYRLRSVADDGGHQDWTSAWRMGWRGSACVCVCVCV